MRTREDMYSVTASRAGPVTSNPFIDVERSHRAHREQEDEDLNKYRDLVTSDDGCDLARRGKELR